jgi:hypothetical protein
MGFALCYRVLSLCGYFYYIELSKNSMNGIVLLPGYSTDHFLTLTWSGLGTILVRLYSQGIHLDVSSEHFYACTRVTSPFFYYINIPFYPKTKTILVAYGWSGLCLGISRFVYLSLSNRLGVCEVHPNCTYRGEKKNIVALREKSSDD